MPPSGGIADVEALAGLLGVQGPGQQYVPPRLHGRLDVRKILLPTPAAGVDFATVPVPSGAKWLPRVFVGQLITAAAAANRILRTDYQDPLGVIFGGSAVGCLHPATITAQYRGLLGGSHNYTNGTALTAASVPTFPLPNLELPPDSRIAFVTTNIQAADQWSGGMLVVEEIPEEEE